MARVVYVVIVLQIWSSIVIAQFAEGLGGLGLFGAYGLLGGSLGVNLRQFFGRNSMLARAVREIVHPDARPTQGMMEIAVRHRGPPENLRQMQEYTPHFTYLAFHHNVRPNGTSYGRTPSLNDMNNYMLTRGERWMSRMGLLPARGLPGATGSRRQGSPLAVLDLDLPDATTASPYQMPSHPSRSSGRFTGRAYQPLVDRMAGSSNRLNPDSRTNQRSNWQNPDMTSVRSNRLNPNANSNQLNPDRTSLVSNRLNPDRTSARSNRLNPGTSPNRVRPDRTSAPPNQQLPDRSSARSNQQLQDRPSARSNRRHPDRANIRTDRPKRVRTAGRLATSNVVSSPSDTGRTTGSSTQMSTMETTEAMEVAETTRRTSTAVTTMELDLPDRTTARATQAHSGRPGSSNRVNSEWPTSGSNQVNLERTTGSSSQRNIDLSTRTSSQMNPERSIVASNQLNTEQFTGRSNQRKLNLSPGRSTQRNLDLSTGTSNRQNLDLSTGSSNQQTLDLSTGSSNQLNPDWSTGGSNQMIPERSTGSSTQLDSPWSNQGPSVDSPGTGRSNANVAPQRTTAAPYVYQPTTNPFFDNLFLMDFLDNAFGFF